MTREEIGSYLGMKLETEPYLPSLWKTDQYVKQRYVHIKNTDGCEIVATELPMTCILNPSSGAATGMKGCLRNPLGVGRRVPGNG